MGKFKEFLKGYFSPEEMTPKRIFMSLGCVFYGVVNVLQHTQSQHGSKVSLWLGIAFIVFGVLIFLFRRSWFYWK